MLEAHDAAIPFRRLAQSRRWGAAYRAGRQNQPSWREPVRESDPAERVATHRVLAFDRRRPTPVGESVDHGFQGATAALTIILPDTEARS
ncbi:MAG: hypothetical protein KC635_08910 [Myxococcales bacterium]|nr:hypothetical protein [Myxococcales bacterium]MCB9733456.1 hypothetical protein [Deltaproteobacteria bacterium]